MNVIDDALRPSDFINIGMPEDQAIIHGLPWSEGVIKHKGCD